jgi:hypothetical protein
VNSTVGRNELRDSGENGVFTKTTWDCEIHGELTDAKRTPPLRRYATEPSDLLADQASPREWIWIRHVEPFRINVFAFKSTHVRHVGRARATPLPRFSHASNSPNDRPPNRLQFLEARPKNAPLTETPRLGF